MKALSEMSLEELWQLFPIFLVEHNEKWATSYAEMAAFLKRIFESCSIHRTSHIGSTAIQGIWAKDIVDILVETEDVEGAAGIAERNGFIRMSSEPQRVSLNRGYTPKALRTRYTTCISAAGRQQRAVFPGLPERTPGGSLGV